MENGNVQNAEISPALTPNRVLPFLRLPLKHVLVYLFVMAGVGYIILRGASEQGYHWQWYRIPQYLYTFKDGTFTLGPLLEGLKITLHITWISMILTYAIGLLTALLASTACLPLSWP